MSIHVKAVYFPATRGDNMVELDWIQPPWI